MSAWHKWPAVAGGGNLELRALCQRLLSLIGSVLKKQITDSARGSCVWRLRRAIQRTRRQTMDSQGWRTRSMGGRAR
jgi:hypothetical protein